MNARVSGIHLERLVMNRMMHTKIILSLGAIAFFTSLINDDVPSTLGVTYGLLGWMYALRLEKKLYS